MSLESQLTRIANAKEAIRQVLILYELDVPTSVKIESYASLVRSLLPPKGSVTQAMSRIGVRLEEIPIANISETVSVTTAAPVIGNPTQSMASVVVSLSTIPICAISEAVGSDMVHKRDVINATSLSSWSYDNRYIMLDGATARMKTSQTYESQTGSIDSGKMCVVSGVTTGIEGLQSITVQMSGGD